MKVGFLGLLGLAFIILKLTEIISWSWWAVLAPVYIPMILGVVLLVIYVVIAVKTGYFNSYQYKNRK